MSKLARTYDRSRVPLYIQVASVMRRRIEDGFWQPGQKISTLEELEREFEVARVTVRQAIDLLREEGLLRCQQGRGTFISKDPPRRRWLTLATDWASLLEPIKDNVPRLIKVDHPPRLPCLEAGEGSAAPEYKFLRSVQYKDDEPYGVVSLHLARRVFDRAPEEFLQHPALPVLASLDGLRIKHAHQTLVIGGADPEIAHLLRLGIGAPTAECRCVVVDDQDIAIYVADLTYRSDCVKLQMNFGSTRGSKARAVASSRKGRAAGISTLRA